MELLDEQRRVSFLSDHDGWSIDGETLSKTFEFDSFARAVGFVASIGVLAEKEFHHPDIDIRYTKVLVSLTTHDAGGLTERDTELADRIEQL